MLKKLVVTLGVTTALLAPGAVIAEPFEAKVFQSRDRYTAGEARDARRQGDVVPAIRVISQVRQRYPRASVLDAELEGGSNPRYIVKILTEDGRRIDVVADARTGAILFER
ncbi:PepSY domain-containing protein [Maricaulis sp.]|uniref:PepSY domain-containing protein n=1 Tax=unclassified Maricaulis TaxID=2632371 RepID=UPI001B02E9A1|nr:PepSY domain-containing protein [Maricaulis sp.]MBO6797130.1 hypothetical protein [Maricaulis sp.]